MTGIAVAYHVLPTCLLERLDRRVLRRGGEPEVQFLWYHVPRRLPVWTEHGIELVRWGCRRGESRQLPCTRWTMLSTVKAGKGAEHRPERVEIPASLILHNGRWIAVRQGVQGLLVRDEAGMPVVYVLCEPASHYYEVMTRLKWAAVLVGERI
jgi:hypothetical protein